MNKTVSILLALAGILTLCSCGERGLLPNGQWTAEKANQWYETTGWRSGCDFIPSTAINQIEMWQSSSFDSETIDRELGWMQELGFSTARVYLSSVVWQNEPEAFKVHMDEFLAMTDRHGIKPVFVFFDDCWNAESEFGVQPEPKPGVHNSGWVQDPAVSLRADTLALYPVLERYMKDVLTTFKKDNRILWWDLYNEPGNSHHRLESWPLVKNCFKWAREVRPSQPISSGVWSKKYADNMGKYQLENSDIISYHDYSKVESHLQQVISLKEYGRPMFCTEYMARRDSSFFQTVLPMLKEQNVSAINWGFVAGKTNTIYAWDEPIPSGEEPALWFHDIYRQDKTPFCQEEIDVIKSVNGVQKD